MGVQLNRFLQLHPLVLTGHQNRRRLDTVLVLDSHIVQALTETYHLND